MPTLPLFFDDFSHANLSAMEAAGWVIRRAAGHPGVPGARWGTEGLQLLRDADGHHVLRLTARTHGVPNTGESVTEPVPPTQQAQVCHARKYLNGTYAARVKFADQPVSGQDGDPVIQTFYAASPLRFDFDPEFSELDWEYLPNGGWGSPLARLYSITWQTVRIEPWTAHNQLKETFGAMPGWHTLVMQVQGGEQPATRFFLDGQAVATHGGRNHPVSPMAISFNLWFSPGGLLPVSREARVYQQDVDWVMHVPGVTLTPAEVDALVRQQRDLGVGVVDTVAAPVPVLPSPCNL